MLFLKKLLSYRNEYQDFEIGDKMRAIQITEANTFKSIKQKKCKPKNGEVLLKIIQVGICGSDILIYHGKHKYAKLPLVMGHECAAIVEDVGEGVDTVAIGDLVTVQPHFFCNDCYACKRGSTNVCEDLVFMGVHIDGFFREYVTVKSWNVLKLPSSFTIDMAMLVEPLAVAVNAARKGDVKEGERAVVIGAGTIGNLTAQSLAAMGVEVLISDILDNKLFIVGNCGIHHCLNTSCMDLEEGIQRSFNGGKVSAIYDCAAVPKVMKQIIDCAANSSKIIIIGSYKEPVELDITRLQRREISLLGVMQYSREDFLNAIAMLNEGKININGIITRRYSLDNLNEAFQYIDEQPQNVMKVAIECCEQR